MTCCYRLHGDLLLPDPTAYLNHDDLTQFPSQVQTSTAAVQDGLVTNSGPWAECSGLEPELEFDEVTVCCPVRFYAAFYAIAVS